VANIVEQGGYQHGGSVGGQVGVAPLELIKGATGDRHHPQRMGKTGTFCPMKGETGRAKLTDPTQPLKGRRINQLRQQGLIGVAGVEGNRTMQGVMVGATGLRWHGWRGL
jgi:hypothetical protein